jgi:hypothetical protein
MARGTTLSNMLSMLRVEARLSKLPAHNIAGREQQIEMLQRKQDFFWDDFDWPQLRVERYIELQEGQRYYSPPDDVKVDRIQTLAVRNASAWMPLENGISDGNYAAFDSDLDARGDPAQRWRIVEDEDGDEAIEIWPIPNTDFDSVTLEGKVRVVGIRNLNPFVAESDTADLDDRLLVLHCAAEMLAAAGAKDAQLKLDQATKHYAKLRGNMVKRTKMRLFGPTADEMPRRPGDPPQAIYRVA